VMMLLTVSDAETGVIIGEFCVEISICSQFDHIGHKC